MLPTFIVFTMMTMTIFSFWMFGFLQLLASRLSNLFDHLWLLALLLLHFVRGEKMRFSSERQQPHHAAQSISPGWTNKHLRRVTTSYKLHYSETSLNQVGSWSIMRPGFPPPINLLNWQSRRLLEETLFKVSCLKLWRIELGAAAGLFYNLTAAVANGQFKIVAK